MRPWSVLGLLLVWMAGCAEQSWVRTTDLGDCGPLESVVLTVVNYDDGVSVGFYATTVEDYCRLAQDHEDNKAAHGPIYWEAIDEAYEEDDGQAGCMAHQAYYQALAETGELLVPEGSCNLRVGTNSVVPDEYPISPPSESLLYASARLAFPDGRFEEPGLFEVDDCGEFETWEDWKDHYWIELAYGSFDSYTWRLDSGAVTHEEAKKDRIRATGSGLPATNTSDDSAGGFVDFDIVASACEDGD